MIAQSRTGEEFLAANRANNLSVLIEMSPFMNSQGICALELKIANFAFIVSFFDVFVLERVK